MRLFSFAVVCVLDKTRVATFDHKIYPLKLGNCWHVVMTTYPKRNFNNPEKTLAIPQYSKMLVLAREMDDGSKQMRIILGDQEIHLQKSNNRLEATVNGQLANFSHKSYREDEFEIYQLDGMIVIYSLEYEIHAVYDGERMLIRVSKKIKQVVHNMKYIAFNIIIWYMKFKCNETHLLLAIHQIFQIRTRSLRQLRYAARQRFHHS